MKIIKIIDGIIIIVISIVGTIYELYPPIIPGWLFNVMWIVGPIVLIVFGIILYLENKQNKK